VSGELTLADLRARIAERGLSSRIKVVGDPRRVHRLDITLEEFDRWLDETEADGTGVLIRVGVRRRQHLWQLVIDRVRNVNRLRINGRGRDA